MRRDFLTLLPLAAALLLLRTDVMAEPLAPFGHILATPIPLMIDDPARQRVGALVYEGGWTLRGEDPWVGGVSAMAIATQRTGEQRFWLLSDEGRIITFRMGADAVPRGAWVRRLPGPGRIAQRRKRDTESMARDPATGRMWVGLEARNMILRLDPRASRVERQAHPRAMRGWPANGGAETLVRLQDGRFLILSESATRRPGTRVALLFSGDPTEAGPPPIAFAYVPPAGFDPTDAAELPDGRIVVLNRHLALHDGVAAAVTLFPAAEMRAGVVVRGREIARLHRPLAVDNMEAIAVTRERGATMLWIASDDNLTLMQRTLLLKFRLSE